MNDFGIFAKHWLPGNVKTRLGRSLGFQAASEVYFAMLCHLLRRLTTAGDRRVVAYSPPESQAEFEHLLSDQGLNRHQLPHGQWSLQPQVEESLGVRMQQFFTQRFATGASRVVLIGSDCPAATTKLCEQAFAMLGDHDVVLGPTPDGGYWLIGMSGRCHDVFSDIIFSTESVLEATRQRLSGLGLSLGLLPILQDIDHLEDLQQWLDQTADSNHNVDHPGTDVEADTASLRQTITAILSDATPADLSAPTDS